MNNVNKVTGFLPDEAATQKLAECFSQLCTPGLALYLKGDLGAGKTTFTRGVLHGLGYHGKVKSPTYTLVESYPLDHFTLHHFDLYRFADPEEWEDAGFREYFSKQTLCIVEWPEKAGVLLPAADLELELHVSNTGRSFCFQAYTETGRSCLIRLSTLLDANS